MFHVFDKDDDGLLNEEDVKTLIGRMVGDYMNTVRKTSAMKDISIPAASAKLFEEADIDGNRKISMNEFKTLCENLPDFERKFTFRPERYVV
jgi:Ca2+-binding EF-hand superfamily protein